MTVVTGSITSWRGEVLLKSADASKTCASSSHVLSDWSPHLWVFFSCRETDRVHQSTAAPSHLLPLLSWAWEIPTSLLRPNPIPPLSSAPSCSFSLFFSCLVTFLRGSTLPVDKLDKGYENSKILTTRLYHRGNKATARANDATTMLRSVDNTNTLEEQRLRLHLETKNKLDTVAEFVRVEVQMSEISFP